MIEEARKFIMDALYAERLDSAEYELLLDAFDNLEADRDRWKSGHEEIFNASGEQFGQLLDITKDRDRWKTKYEELDAGVADQIGRTLDAVDELDTAIQERDRWKARAEALERAIKGACADCKHSREGYPCDDTRCEWPFDEAGFKKG